jgi:hypothetical protein
MKKQLNVDQIQSELRGGSAFFPGYKGDQSPTSPPEERSEQAPKVTPRKKSVPVKENADSQGVPLGEPHGVPYGVPEEVPLAVPLIPKKPKRPIRQRQPFDIYEDQYQALKKIATAERDFENGRSMGQMVREAIDEYLVAGAKLTNCKKTT